MIDGMKSTAAAREAIDVQDRRAGMLHVWNGPLKSFASLEAQIVDTTIRSRQRGDLIHDPARRRIVPAGVRASRRTAGDGQQSPCHIGDDLPVGARGAGRIDRLPQKLHAALGIGESYPFFIRHQMPQEVQVQQFNATILLIIVVAMSAVNSTVRCSPTRMVMPWLSVLCGPLSPRSANSRSDQ